MRTNVALVLTLRTTAEQRVALARNAGASRFAWNWCVERFSGQNEARRRDPATKMLYTSFDYIDAFNKWKNSAEAGYDEANGVGLPWRTEVSAQAMENACADCGQAVVKLFANVRDRKAKKTKLRVGPPQFKGRLQTKASFRLRNANGKGFHVTKKGVKVPKLGYLRVREGTSRLRELLRAGEDFGAGRILFATLSYVDRFWRLSLNLEVDVLLLRRRMLAKQRGARRIPVLGCDLGIRTLACLADPEGTFVQACLEPKDVARWEDGLASLRRRVDAKRNASRLRAKEAGDKRRAVGVSEERARRRLVRLHARQRWVRLANIHKLTTELATRCDVIGIEDLNVAGMLKNHCLARAIARQAWGELRRQITYKSAWTGTKLVVVDRFFPSTQRCSRCHEREGSLPLDERTLRCLACGLCLDRDVNAAINLAQVAQQEKNASPEELGKGKTPELERLGAAIGPTGASPPERLARSGSRKGIAQRKLSGSSKERVDFVNAP